MMDLMNLQDAQSLHQSGDLQGAIAAYESLVKANKNDAAATHFLGMAKLQAGDTSGDTHLQRAIELEPENELFQTNYANLKAQMGDLKTAYALFEATTQKSPQNLLAQEGAGQCAMRLGNMLQALGHFKTVLAHDKNRLKSLELAGIVSFRMGRYAETKVYFNKVLGHAPKHIGSHLHLGLIGLAEENFPVALHHLQTAESIQPNNPSVHMELGRAYLAATAFAKAATHFNKVLTLRPDAEEAITYLAKAHFGMNNMNDATKCADQILAKDPKNAEMLTLKANMASAEGDTEKAFNFARDAAMSTPDFAWGFLSATHIDAGRIDEDMFNAMKTGLDGCKNDVEKSKWHYAIARTLDARKSPIEAWEHFSKGADIIHNNISEKAHEDMNLMKLLMDTFKAPLPKANNNVNLPWTPIFIVGMPRSGSTLVEQILTTSPDVFDGGELSLVRTIALQICGGKLDKDSVDILTSQEAVNAVRELYASSVKTLFPDIEAKFFTDKMPFNALWLPLISAAFPEAKIIYTDRDPVSICVSCYKQMFNTGQWFSYNQETLAETYATFKGMMHQYMQNSSVYTAAYEDIVSTPETHIKELVEHTGLKWSEDFLNFHKAKRTVRTASMQQVNKPLYTSSVKSWEPIQEQLKPLISALKAKNIML